MLFSFVLLCPFLSRAQEQAGQEQADSLNTVTQASPDSLTAKRHILGASIHQNGKKLRMGETWKLLEGNRKARRSFLSGKLLTPVGPVLSGVGAALGYLAIKGKPAVAYIQYNQENITTHYVIRSRPKLAAGIVLFFGGFVLVESSKDLISRSVKKFNLQPKNPDGAQKLDVQVGINSNGQLTLSGRF